PEHRISTDGDPTAALVELALEGPAPYLVRRLQQIVTAIFADEMLEFDVTAPQYAALSVIVTMPNLDQNATAYLAGIDRTTIVGVINRLVRKRLVRRTLPKSDKRVRLLQPTPTGVQFVERVRENIDRIGARLLAPLPKDQRQTFCETIRKILRVPLRQEARLVNAERLRLQPLPGDVRSRVRRRRRKARLRSRGK
ncbi:MAG: MarR family winged helix-turn-helix transcriptional regulator, partial [Bryobacteraceae bacterium]